MNTASFNAGNDRVAEVPVPSLLHNMSCRPRTAVSRAGKHRCGELRFVLRELLKPTGVQYGNTAGLCRLFGVEVAKRGENWDALAAHLNEVAARSQLPAVAALLRNPDRQRVPSVDRTLYGATAQTSAPKENDLPDRFPDANSREMFHRAVEQSAAEKLKNELRLAENNMSAGNDPADVDPLATTVAELELAIAVASKSNHSVFVRDKRPMVSQIWMRPSVALILPEEQVREAALKRSEVARKRQIQRARKKITC